MKNFFPAFTVLFVFIFTTIQSKFITGEDSLSDQPFISNLFYGTAGASMTRKQVFQPVHPPINNFEIQSSLFYLHCKSRLWKSSHC